MASNVSRGARAKGKTKKWLIAKGWTVADLEIVRWIVKPGAPPMPVKRDQLGSDLLALSPRRLVFVQVKSGAEAEGKGNFPKARREFDRFTFPPFVRLWIVAWPARSSVPRIIVHDPHAPKESHGKTSKKGRSRFLVGSKKKTR